MSSGEMRVKVTASADRQDAIRTATAQPAPVLIVRTSIAGEVATPKAAVPDRDRVLAADVKKAAVEASSKDAQATGNAFNGIEVGTVAQRMRKDVHKPKSKYPTFISKPSEGLQYTSDTVKSFGSGEMSNTQYKVMQVASNPSNALDSAERNAIVIKKWPADGGRKSIEKPRNTTSQASKRKSTHDRTFDLAKVDQLTDESMAAGENMRNVVKYFRSQSTNNSETYVQPSVTEVRSIEPSTDASAKTGTAGNQPQQESSIPQPEPMATAALTSSIGAQQGLEVQSKRFPSPDGAAKVSREIKSLKETQSQSKVLAEFLDGASRQGKLRKRRSSSVSPAGTNASKQLPPAAAGSGIAHRKRLQSRCFVEDPEDPSPVGLTNRRTGMRSENEDFKMKQQRFLHNLHDKATEAMDDSVEEDTSHDLPMTANDSLSSFGSDGVMKSLDETFGSVAEPPKPGYDRYCFRCKQSRGEQLVGCNSCVRSFHQGCTRPTYSDDNWTCQECRSSSLAHETNPFPTEGYVNLHDCLQSLVESLLGTPDADRLFNPLDKAAIKNYERVTHHMDLVVIASKVQSKQYKTAEDLLADLSWIVHNIAICSESSKTLSAAKSLYKNGKVQIVNMETCRECFMNLYKKQATWFKEACTKPHLLVWAKLKGFPHWPGKVMSVNGNNQADVRFFGEHDRAWVAAKDCYLFSKETPNPQKTAKKLPLSESLLEAGAHVENLIKRFGSFNYAPYRTPLDTTRIDEHLKEMVPNAFEETRPSAPQLKIKIINNHGKMTAHTSKPSIGETPAPVEKTSSDISSSTDATNSKKRLTRRASKAATLIEGEAASEVPETERFGKVAKKRKSVCFLNQVATESSVEKLVIHRNLGNWATENITKRRKSVMVSPVEPNCESNAHGKESNGHVADQNPSVAEGGEGVQEVPSTGTSRNIASNPSPDSSYSEALSFPIPIKVELDYDEFDRAPSSGDSSASRSTATIEQTHERARPAAAVVSENVAKSNQKARKSFPGARTMTIVPKASVPESNSPIIMDSTTAAEAPANNGPASSNGTVGNKETPKPSSVSSSGYVVPAGSTNVQLPSNKVIKALPSMVLVRSVEKTVVSQSPPTLLQSVSTSNNQQPRLASVSMTAALPVAQVTTVISKPCPVVAPTSIPATVAPVKEPMQTSTQSVVSISSSSSSTTSTSSNNSSKSKENLGTAPTSAPILSLTPQEAPLNVPQNVASYKQQFRISPVSVPASGVLPLTNELPPATSAPQQSSAGSVNSSRVTVRNFGTANNNSNACSSLPEDLDVIVIDEGSPEPSPSAGRQNVKRNYSQRNSTLPPLQPKPRSDAQEEEFEGNVSVSELLDNYASQVAEKSRGMIEQTLRQLAEGGSLHAKVTQLTLELEQVKRQHSLTIERLTKEHQEQLKSMRLDKIRCLAKAKKTMWCRNCPSEASYYCCWNTAYCSDKCQNDHWSQHQSVCAQLEKGMKFTNATVSSTPEGSGSFVSPYASFSKAKVQVRQRTPVSSPATSNKILPAAGYHHQDQQFSHAGGSMRMAPNSTIVARSSAISVAGGPSNIYTTPRIHSVQSHATGFDTHHSLYSNSVNGGGGSKSSATTTVSSQAQRRKQLQTSPTSIATRDTTSAGDFSSEARLMLASTSVSNGNLGRPLITTAPLASTMPTITLTPTGGRVGNPTTTSTPVSRSNAPSVWNQIVVQSASGASTGESFFDPSAFRIGTLQHPAAILGCVPNASGTSSKNGSDVGNTTGSSPNTTTVRRHPR